MLQSNFSLIPSDVFYLFIYFEQGLPLYIKGLKVEAISEGNGRSGC